jgi:PqqD family protein of HPr-rel-A system
LRYRAPRPEALLTADLDAFTATFHRPSGITHLLASPAPEILAALGDAPLDLDGLLARLSVDYDLGDADREALSARLDELVLAGLIEAA